MQHSMSGDNSHVPVVAAAAEASSTETVEAIGAAAEVNEDPVVAEILDDAAVAAVTTASRVGWLNRAMSRLFGRSS